MDVMKKFVLVPEVCPVGSMTSKPPGGGGVRYSASVCPASCRMRASGGLCWEGRLAFVRFEGWPVVSGLGGNPAGFAGRAKRDELCRSGRNPGWWTCGGGTSSGTVRAFGSGNDPGRWTYGGNATLMSDNSRDMVVRGMAIP